MKTCSTVAGVLAGLTLLVAAPFAMAACSLHATPITVKMRGLLPTAPVKVNGRDLTFVVDSGSFFNSINAQFAFDQKMKRARPRNAETGTRLADDGETLFSGVGGQMKVAALVQADQFQFAGVNFQDVVFLTQNTPLSGLIGQNLLGLWDVEYDFHDEVMKLVDPQGCKDTNLAYWVTSGAYSVMPLERLQPADRHTAGSVFINGVKMRALFDTGAGVSFVTRRAAIRAGVQTTDDGVKAAGFIHGLDRGRIPVWVARFASVKIADEEIKNGLLEIGQTDADDFDVLIGADFFLAHHVYVANSQQKIYFSYTGGQVFNVAPQPETAPPAAPAS